MNTHIHLAVEVEGATDCWSCSLPSNLTAPRIAPVQEKLRPRAEWNRTRSHPDVPGEAARLEPNSSGSCLLFRDSLARSLGEHLSGTQSALASAALGSGRRQTWTQPSGGLPLLSQPDPRKWTAAGGEGAWDHTKKLTCEKLPGGRCKP